MAKLKKFKKAKDLGDGSFKHESGTIDTFGPKVVAHDLLAKGAEAHELQSLAKIEDPGTGGAVILRRFSFQLPPHVRFSKQELLTVHRSRIVAFLWKDELELIMEPKVVLGKKGQFDIYATCKAKQGSLIFQQPQVLQDAKRNTR